MTLTRVLNIIINLQVLCRPTSPDEEYPNFYVNLKGAVCGNDSQGCTCLCTARKKENATEERSRYVTVL